MIQTAILIISMVMNGDDSGVGNFFLQCMDKALNPDLTTGDVGLMETAQLHMLIHVFHRVVIRILPYLKIQLSSPPHPNEIIYFTMKRHCKSLFPCKQWLSYKEINLISINWTNAPLRVDVFMVIYPWLSRG